MLTATKTMTPREAAKEILWNRNQGISWKAAQFLGQLVGLPDRPLSEAQMQWLGKLMAEAGLTQGGDA